MQNGKATDNLNQQCGNISIVPNYSIVGLAHKKA